MDKLSEDERQAIVLRVELQLPYAESPKRCESPARTPRAWPSRALVRLAEEMGHEG